MNRELFSWFSVVGGRQLLVLDTHQMINKNGQPRIGGPPPLNETQAAPANGTMATTGGKISQVVYTSGPHPGFGSHLTQTYAANGQQFIAHGVPISLSTGRHQLVRNQTCVGGDVNILGQTYQLGQTVMTTEPMPSVILSKPIQKQPFISKVQGQKTILLENGKAKNFQVNTIQVKPNNFKYAPAQPGQVNPQSGHNQPTGYRKITTQQFSRPGENGNEYVVI